MAKKISPQIQAIRDAAERANQARAWETKLYALIGTIPALAMAAMARNPQEHYLFFKPAANGAWGEFAIAPDAPEGFELASPLVLNHIAYQAIPQRLMNEIRRLPICGN